MNPMQAKVKAFHEQFGGGDPDFATIPDERTQQLRLRLIEEETREFAEASSAGDLPSAIKELCDLLYVVLGSANAYGVDIEPFFDEVHRSNMSKLWSDGAIHKDAHGKVPLLQVVREAEELWRQREDSKSYLPIDGAPAFNFLVQGLALGADSPAIGGTDTGDHGPS